MIAANILLLLAMQDTETPAKARRPPDERLQDHGQNAVVKHDPVGAKVDIVAEDFGTCPGPGPTTIMRLRSAEKEHAVVVTVAKSVNVGGAITVSNSSYTVAPMSFVDLGCLAQPVTGGGKPLVNEWKIVFARMP